MFWFDIYVVNSLVKCVLQLFVGNDLSCSVRLNMFIPASIEHYITLLVQCISYTSSTIYVENTEVQIERTHTHIHAHLAHHTCLPFCSASTYKSA